MLTLAVIMATVVQGLSKVMRFKIKREFNLENNAFIEPVLFFKVFIKVFYSAFFFTLGQLENSTLVHHMTRQALPCHLYDNQEG